MGRYQAQKKPLKDEFGTEVIELRDEQAGLAACVAPQHGAELSSLKVRWRGKWLELLYRGNDFSPIQGWRGRAPLLWPAVGRNYTHEQLAEVIKAGHDEPMGTYKVASRRFKMPIHGFAMNKPWRVRESGADAKAAWAVCELAPDDETRQYCPFEFTLSVTCRLSDGRVALRYAIAADKTNSWDMPFCIGNHISVNFPFTGQGQMGDGILKTPFTQQLLITPQSLLSGESTPVDAAKGARLSTGRFYNSVFGGFPPGQSWLELTDPRSFSLRVEQREVLDPPGAKPKTTPDHFLAVFYGDPQKKLICPEPWVGGPNSLNTGERLVRLKPGETFAWEMIVKLLGIT